MALNTLYFNVYINGIMAMPSTDLTTLTGALSTAYYKDFVLNSMNVTNNTIMVKVLEFESPIRDWNYFSSSAAEQNFTKKAVIGVGGFGKGYLSVLEDGTTLTVKNFSSPRLLLLLLLLFSHLKAVSGSVSKAVTAAQSRRRQAASGTVQGRGTEVQGREGEGFRVCVMGRK
ncbi:hypothetical protein TorRG33x02_071270 [Trema orientale]|uniref:Uncharacterized protein n=1 Tax=Trema orientale TaxID=63057 RepID=A0A2P5FGZ9_TREOI|nr:hypothetical protein TorRG33x02_071270 [Trema orientale]